MMTEQCKLLTEIEQALLQECGDPLLSGFGRFFAESVFDRAVVLKSRLSDFYTSNLSVPTQGIVQAFSLPESFNSLENAQAVMSQVAHFMREQVSHSSLQVFDKAARHLSKIQSWESHQLGMQVVHSLFFSASLADIAKFEALTRIFNFQLAADFLSPYFDESNEMLSKLLVATQHLEGW